MCKNFKGTAHTNICIVFKREMGRWRKGGFDEYNNYLRFFFSLNGINLLEYVCICSAEEEGKLATKT